MALALAVWAGWTDWRSRRIPNWLTVPAFFIGVGAHWMVAGGKGAVFSMSGAAIALFLLFPFVLLRALGAGDWKLMGALGAFLGAQVTFLVLFGTVLITGIMGVVQITRLRKWRETLANMWELILVFLSFGCRVHPKINLDNPGALSLPFGTAAAFSTLVCYGLARL
jgi:prepilin peptidase CpaA